MKTSAPRKMSLVSSQTDGFGARVFDFAIDEPMDCDRNAIPGQFFMLGIPGGGEAPFSYLDMPDGTGAFRALIRRQGELTAALFSQPHGAVLNYRGPCGVGWPLLLRRCRVMLIAADLGLTALAAFIEEAHGSGLPLDLNLLHFTNSARSLTLDAAKKRWNNYVNVLEVNGIEATDLLHQGQLLLHVERLLEQERPEAMFCCAAEAFTRAVAKLGTARGVRPERIWLHVDHACGGGLFRNHVPSEPYLCRDGSIYRYDRYRQQLNSEDQPPRWPGC